MQEVERPIRFHEIAPLLEVGCWTILALAPVLRLVNGPAVSADQLIVQIGLVCIGAVGAVALRIYNLRVRRLSKAMRSRNQKNAPNDE